MNNKNLTIRVSEKDLKKLDIISKKMGLTKSAVIRFLIFEQYNKLRRSERNDKSN